MRLPSKSLGKKPPIEKETKYRVSNTTDGYPLAPVTLIISKGKNVTVSAEEYKKKGVELWARINALKASEVGE